MTKEIQDLIEKEAAENYEPQFESLRRGYIAGATLYAKKMENYPEWVDDSYIRNFKKGWANLWNEKLTGDEYTTSELCEKYLKKEL